MEEILGKLYNELANQIVEIIPADWDDIYYLGEVEKEKQSWSSLFYFTDIDKNKRIRSHDIPRTYNVPKSIYMELLDVVDKTLLAIYDCFIQNGAAPWEQLSFYLNKNEKFEIEFFYDVMNENNGQIRREVVWAYKKFGYLPEEGTYTRNILDEYLNEI